MKRSRTSLNKPFYDWIKEVREADKKITELEDKLYYYNVKLIGYKSPNFEPRLSSTKPEYKDNRHIWITKIEKIEREINHYFVILEKYKNIVNTLNNHEKEIINSYLKGSINYIKHSKTNVYYILNKVSREHF